VQADDYRPLLPRQRLAAARARIEMEAHDALRRVELGTATAGDAEIIRRALFLIPRPSEEATP